MLSGRGAPPVQNSTENPEMRPRNIGTEIRTDPVHIAGQGTRTANNAITHRTPRPWPQTVHTFRTACRFTVTIGTGFGDRIGDASTFAAVHRILQPSSGQEKITGVSTGSFSATPGGVACGSDSRSTQHSLLSLPSPRESQRSHFSQHPAGPLHVCPHSPFPDVPDIPDSRIRLSTRHSRADTPCNGARTPRHINKRTDKTRRTGLEHTSPYRARQQAGTGPEPAHRS